LVWEFSGVMIKFKILTAGKLCEPNAVEAKTKIKIKLFKT